MLQGILCGLSILILSGTTFADDVSNVFVYFGTYTGKGSEGIYVAQQDKASGKLSEPVLAARVTNPSFLAVHPNRRFLYAVSEVETTNGKKGGGVTSFEIDRSTGKLNKINAQACGGGAPCHISIDKTGKCAVIANYSGGNVSSLPIKEDGSLGEVVSNIKHTGNSINKQRQEGPHAHSINIDRNNRFAVAADLGTDEIRVYRLNASEATLTPHAIVKVPEGGGPRHFVFHPSQPLAFTNNELTSNVTGFRYDAEKGILTALGTVTTLPEHIAGNSTAEIKVHPNGKFVFVSNRGHNSIALFHIETDGSLTPKGHFSTQGKTPRNFNLWGHYLIAANQDSNDVFVFKIDEATGSLAPTGSSIKVSMPVCVVYVER